MIQMSREQWGHGYNKGYEDGKKDAKSARYLLTLDDDCHLKNIYIIRERHDDTLVVELFNDPAEQLVWFGKCFPFDESVKDTELYEEINKNEIGKHKFFFSQDSMMAFLTNDYEKWRRENNDPR